MSFLILIVLVFSEMIMPLAALNFTNAAVIQDFERECTLMEQGQHFFESAAPLGDCTIPWRHGMQCRQNQCKCGVFSFGQIAELQQRLLSSDDRQGDKTQIDIIRTSELNTTKGIRNFCNLFGLNRTDSITAAFRIGNSSSGEQSSNILFGGRWIITRTWQSLCSLLNDSADLIRRLLFALRQSYEQNQALNGIIGNMQKHHEGTIRNMQAHHEDYVRTIEMEKQTTQMALAYLRSTAAEADKIIRDLTKQNVTSDELPIPKTARILSGGFSPNRVLNFFIPFEVLRSDTSTVT